MADADKLARRAFKAADLTIRYLSSLSAAVESPSSAARSWLAGSAEIADQQRDHCHEIELA